jgi:hypothetical protein
LLVILAAAHAPALEPLHYNNPGLTVDLAVGLWANPLPMDFDGDGHLDLVVDCADKPSNGVYFFRNATGDTADNPFPVFQRAQRISAGAQNVQLSYVGGQPFVLAPATEYPDFLKSGLERPKKLPLPANIHPHNVRGNFWKRIDYDGDGKLDLIVGVDDWTDYGWDNAYDATGHWTHGPLHGFVYLLRNAGTNEEPLYESPVKIQAGDQSIDTFGWPCPCLADFTGHGKLDLICGEFLDGFTYFENIGTRTAPKYAPGRRLKTSDGQPLTMDLEMIMPIAIDWNKDGHVDLIVGDEDGRVAFIENTGKEDADHTPIFRAPRYFQQEADLVKFGALASPVGFDWDGDGSTDILCGDSAGYIGFIKNLSAPGVERPKWAAPKYLEADGQPIRIMAGANGSIQGPAEAKWGYTTLSVADWDGDGLPDLIVNSILGQVVWYRNIGTRTEPKLAAAQAIEVEWEGAPPPLAWGWQKPQGKALLTQWRTTPFAVDWNHDGLVDLVMLDQEGYLAFFERAQRDGKLVLLPPKRVFCDEKGEPLHLATGTGGKSGRRKFCLVDWDGDGALDILLNSDNAEWWRQVDERDGKWLFKNMGNLDSAKLAGHDTSPTTVDWNNDGIPDLILGAEDGHLYYLKNPRSK